MSDAQKAKRGRPRKSWPHKRADTVSEYCRRTGESRTTAFRKMKNGLLRFVQSAPGAARHIPFSEYERLGYDVPADDNLQPTP
jgi:hypothetical protein